MLNTLKPVSLKKPDGFFYYLNATFFLKKHPYSKFIIIMKKIASLLVLLFLFNACSPGGETDYLFELLPIESVELPTEFTLGETYPITIHFSNPTSCHYFNQLYYNKDLNIRTIAVESAVAQRGDCVNTPNETGQYTFNFYVTSNGSYIFRFYQGKDDNGENIFVEYEVPVTNKR